LLKMKSLRTVHITHDKTHAPTQQRPLFFLEVPFNQLPNRFVTLGRAEEY
jgi:hypothetical protein